MDDVLELKTKRALWIEEKVFQFWWVAAFAWICFCIYEQGQKSAWNEYLLLEQKYDRLLREKEIALTERENKIREINSQSDPDFVELVLMKGLGLVPEGQKKVFIPK